MIERDCGHITAYCSVCNIANSRLKIARYGKSLEIKCEGCSNSYSIDIEEMIFAITNAKFNE